ncbi:methionine synthase [Leptotrichia sp. oral taxon 218]|uniref:methionine synthase n=1 Tax=Leptotrichia sp. oral taxon 218 TaxID=712361 RepID=UPI001B8D2DC0|nr:methionine synthase [Leptotrichia sp. oral taxon 218]QUB96183.1 methionine synthase [Leptotrichia sp. oral taxon 218]
MATSQYKNSYDFLQNDLKNRILLLDGAMGTMIQKQNLTADDFGGEKYEGCNDYLVLTKPEIIKNIHKEYLKSGSDIIETNSFGALDIVLKDYDLEDRAFEMCKRAAELVNETILEYRSENPDDTRHLYVAGALGPSNKSISVTGGVTFDELVHTYYTAVSGLLAGGVDLILFETIQDTRNLKAAYLGLKKAMEENYTVPLMLSFTIESTGTTLAGQTADAFYYAVNHMHPFSVGLNCATGPEFMTQFLKTLNDISNTYISVYPNAGLPNEDGEYEETPVTLANKLEPFFKNKYLNIVGGCCGTTPDYIKKIKEKTVNYEPRNIDKDKNFNNLSGLISLETPKDRPIYVGERTNVIGSRIFKNLIAQEKFDEATEVARLQIKGDADVIDVCLANPDRDEVADMKAFLEKVSKFAKVPIMLDSTDINVVEKGLTYLQGKGIINSINLEDGEEKFKKMAEVIKEFGAAVVVGLIDEEGMAVSLEKKIKVARRSYELLTKKYGIDERDIIFDTLVFPVATGDQKYIGSASATIEAIREIKKEMPNVKTILGVSNISFGLPIAGREVLNTYYMNKAYEAGLDFAIVNTEKIIPMDEISDEEKELSENILFHTNDENVSKFANFYRDKKATKKKVDVSNLTVEEKVANLVVEGSKKDLTILLDELLKKYTPIEIINGPLMTGMDEVGRLFNKNDLIVAEVLQSAEVMKASVAHLEQFMEKDESSVKGKIIMATVKGDVHDIGKNLVGIIIGNNGYEVIDLGINTPAEKIRDAVVKEKANFLGLSGLLVKSAAEMVNTVAVLREAGISIPIFVGGAALTEKFTVNKIEPAYENNIVIYSKDAMTALSDLNKMIDEKKFEEFREYLQKRRDLLLIKDEKELQKLKVKQTVSDIKDKDGTFDYSKIEIPKYNFEKIYKPETLNKQIITNIKAKDVFPFINLQMLIGKHLGLKWIVGKMLEKQDPRTVKMYNEIKEIIEHGDEYFDITAIYKYFPVRRKYGKEKNEFSLEILSDDLSKVIETFNFPRQKYGQYLSLNDYVNPDGIDYVGFFVATAGEKSRIVSNELKAKGEFYKGHLVNSIGLELAEATSEYIHQIMRKDVGIIDKELQTEDILKANYQGNRYSFGYPACPDLSDQKKLFKLLKPEIYGIKLTDEFMMYPEASVSAIVFSQPFCKYFNM